jgi:HlyD family secretion protein
MAIFPPEITQQTTESHFVKHHTKTKIIYMIFLLMLLGALSTAPFVKTDISRQSRGIITSMKENNDIFSAKYGKLREVRIKENQTVKTGDTLIILHTKKLDEEINYIKEQINQNKKYINELNRLLNGKSEYNTPLYKRKFLEYQQNLSKFVKEMKKTQNDFKRNKKLFNQEVIAEAKFENIKYKYEMAKSELFSYKEQCYTQWENNLEKYRIENKKLASKILRLEKEKEQYTITAPINGVITQYSGYERDNFITPSQRIAKISPTENLLVECYVDPSDIGLLRKGMPVKFQFDAFNHNQWGLGHGKVMNISEDIVQVKNKPQFIVKCSLKDKELALKNGYQGRLMKGMTLTGRFQITERTLYQLLYDKIDDWLNPKLIKKNK